MPFENFEVELEDPSILQSRVEVFVTDSHKLMKRTKGGFEQLQSDTGKKLVLTEEQRSFIEQQNQIQKGLFEN